MKHLEGIPYFYQNGPPSLYNAGGTSMVIPKEGINCQALAHIYYWNTFGIPLPRAYWSKELYEDPLHYFMRIPHSAPLFQGDILLFGPVHLANWKKLHIGIYDEESGTILHTTNTTGSCRWPLGAFASHASYATVYGIRRLDWEKFGLSSFFSSIYSGSETSSSVLQ
ncbi:hypothetical protein KC726_03880 [Candidatus Woesebacteria bacterium]|nr:hypothetical protein [Candidatus Woesebacteria bacterium]